MKSNHGTAVLLPYCLVLFSVSGLFAQSTITALADPGNLVNYRGEIGQTYLFQVTGSSQGSVWGTDIYTDDSALATAAVHAGILREGQTGVVRVTIMAGQSSYAGSTRNGVSSVNSDLLISLVSLPAEGMPEHLKH